MSSELTDIEIVEALKKGDSSVFAELVTRYSEKVYNLSMRITRDEEDASDILQDVFLTVFTKISMFKGESAFSSWLYRITVNTSFMRLRKRKQAASVSIEEISPVTKESWMGRGSESSDVNYMSSRHELRAAIDEAIKHLPEEYRVIFVLRDVDGLSNQEVGEILSLSVPAVKSRLHRSRLMLRRKLKKFYEDYVSSDDIFCGTHPEAMSAAGYDKVQVM